MKVLNYLYKNCRGQSLIEITIVIGVLSIVFAGSFGILHNSYMSINDDLIGMKAHYLVIEGLETARSVRDEDWNSIVDGTWHFEYNDTDPENVILELVSGSETILGAYTRKVEISSVRRDDGNMITEDSAYDVDPDTKLVEVIVEWDFRGKDKIDSQKIYLVRQVESLYES